jgi:hypothetical protein
MSAREAMPAVGRGRVIERTCFRCLAEFATASVDRRVYCPACVDGYGFPAPSIPQISSESGREVA